MKSLMTLVALVAALLFSPAMFARDTTHYLDFQKTVDAAVRDGSLDGSVKFYLKGMPHKGVKRTFSDDFTNKKTSAFGKSDETACDWVLRSVLIYFQEKAKREGANAVINMVSFYKKKTWESKSQYECHAGGTIAGVAMKGTPALLQ